MFSVIVTMHRTGSTGRGKMRNPWSCATGDSYTVAIVQLPIITSEAYRQLSFTTLLRSAEASRRFR